MDYIDAELTGKSQTLMRSLHLVSALVMNSCISNGRLNFRVSSVSFRHVGHMSVNIKAALQLML